MSEFPRMLHNKTGGRLLVKDADEQRAALGQGWKVSRASFDKAAAKAESLPHADPIPVSGFVTPDGTTTAIAESDKPPSEFGDVIETPKKKKRGRRPKVT